MKIVTTKELRDVKETHRQLTIAATLSNGDQTMIGDIICGKILRYNEGEEKKTNKLTDASDYNMVIFKGSCLHGAIANQESYVTSPVIYIGTSVPGTTREDLESFLKNKKFYGIVGGNPDGDMEKEIKYQCRLQGYECIFYNIEKFQIDLGFFKMSAIPRPDLALPKNVDTLMSLFFSLCKKVLIMSVPTRPFDFGDEVLKGIEEAVSRCERDYSFEKKIRIGVVPTTPAPGLFNNTLIKLGLYTHLLYNKNMIKKWMADELPTLMSIGHEVGTYDFNHTYGGEKCNE